MGIVVGLCPHGGQPGIRRTRQPRQPQRLIERPLVQPRVGKRQRHTLPLAGLNEKRPHLGFHQHADGWPKMAEEAIDAAGIVPRQPDLRVIRPQHTCPFAPPRGGAVGQQQAHLGHQTAKGVDQNGGRTGLAQRHRVHPDQRPRFATLALRGDGCLRQFAVVAKPGFDVVRVTGFGLGTFAQLSAQQRACQPRHHPIAPQRQLLDQAQWHAPAPATGRCPQDINPAPTSAGTPDRSHRPLSARKNGLPPFALPEHPWPALRAHRPSTGPPPAQEPLRRR